MENSYADGFAVGTGLKYKTVGIGLTLLPRRYGGEAGSTTETVPTVAVGIDLHVLMVFLCRRLTCWPGGTGPMPMAPIFCRRHRIWPSAPQRVPVVKISSMGSKKIIVVWKEKTNMRRNP
jgi:hypothetical protein